MSPGFRCVLLHFLEDSLQCPSSLLYLRRNVLFLRGGLISPLLSGSLLWGRLSETIRCCFRGSKELQYHSPLCLNAEENSVRGRVIDKKWFNRMLTRLTIRNTVLHPKNLLGCSSIINKKVGRGRTALSFLKTPFLKVTFPSSAPPPGWAGVFSCPYMVKLGPQITVFHVQRACPGTINSLSSLERVWVSCHHCFIVLERVLCFCCLLLLLSNLLSWVIINVQGSLIFFLLIIP